MIVAELTGYSAQLRGKFTSRIRDTASMFVAQQKVTEVEFGFMYLLFVVRLFRAMIEFIAIKNIEKTKPVFKLLYQETGPKKL